MTEPGIAEIPQKFTLYQSVVTFYNRFGLLSEGQPVTTWVDEGLRWYEVCDLETPDGERYDRAEEDLLEVRP